MLSKSEFIEKTLQQVRWKKAHESMKKELSDHIEDQKNAFMRRNMDEDEAMEKAVLEMGDPVEVGTLLDASYRPKNIGGTAIPAAVMIILGLIINFAVTGYIVPQAKVAVGLIIGLPLAFYLPFVLDISLIYKHVWLIYIIYMLFCLFSGIISGYVGLRILNYSILLFPVIYGPMLCRMRGKGSVGLILSEIAMLAAMAAVLAAVHVYAFVLFTLTVCVIMTVYAAVKGWFGGRLTAVLIALMPIAAMVLYMLFSPYAFYFADRFTAMLFPERDLLGRGFQTMTTREYLKNSVFIGGGQEMPVPLPNWNTDSALTSLIHSRGYIVLVILGAVMLTFLAIVFAAVKRQKSQLAKITGYGIFFTFFLNTLWYFISNLGIVGTMNSCPAFLFGGYRAMAVNTFLMGVLASMDRSGSIISDGFLPDKLKRFRIERMNNKIIIHLGDED